MKKLAAVFAVAVLGPSLVLAWLATRSLRDQEIVVHSQRALLHQGASDALAGDLNTFLGDVRTFYGRLLEELIREVGPAELAGNFDAIVRSRWSQASIGAAVTEEEQWINPPVTSTDPDVRRFLRDTQAFLLNSAPSEVYVAPATTGNVVVVQEIAESDWLSSLRSPRKWTAARRNAPPDTLTVRKEDAGALQEDAEAREIPGKTLLLPAVVAAPMPESQGPVAKKTSAFDEAALKRQTAVTATTAGAPMAPTATAPVSPPTAAGGSAPPVAPESKTSETRYVAQQKVAIDEDRYRSRSVSQQLRGAQQAEELGRQQQQHHQAAAGLAGMPAPAPTVATADATAPGGTEPSPHPAASAASAAAEATPPPANFRARNVTPLGQLGQLQQDSQYVRFAEAANNALADNPNRQAWSNLELNTGQLREIMSDAPEGAISRFVSDGLQILLWRRDPAAPKTVFWVQLNLEELKRDLTAIIHETGQRMGNAEVCLALLDASGQVVSQTAGGFTTDWRQPFVATEVGQMLPHWEVAAYLIDPRGVARSARTARLTIWMLVPVLLIAIGVGSALIIRDIGREMAFARQKTDFVSNVSHELKTPLTSIRMFSDLLSHRRDIPDGKRVEYSGIISREAARLSRLINNLLDFSRMERGEKRYRMERLDAGGLVRETVENYRHQIEADGYSLTLADGLDGAEAIVEGDRDAIAQVLLNLLSNAEKYGGAAREIAVETHRDNGAIGIDVLDRGPGIGRRHAAKIFEKFYRAEDSLSSGIEGSGLGLTLARQIARAHRGEVEYSPRPGGGSRFTLCLPVAAPSAPEPSDP